jgi:16S rRNA (uracil1498-N3)-methyltransferase
VNLILLQSGDFLRADQVTLTDRRAQHIQQVLKAKAGDHLKVGLLNGDCGCGVVQKIANNHIEMTVTLSQSPPPKIPLTLLLALPRPKAARRIIRSATELGVEKIILLNSYRVEKSYWQSPLINDANLHQAVLEGLEQSGDTVPPGVQKVTLFKPFVEDKLPQLLESRTGLVAHPHATTSNPPPLGHKALMAIGPEGGFIPYEFEKLQEAGLQGFNLGPRILRVETALPTVIGKLFY